MSKEEMAKELRSKETYAEELVIHIFKEEPVEEVHTEEELHLELKNKPDDDQMGIIQKNEDHVSSISTRFIGEEDCSLTGEGVSPVYVGQNGVPKHSDQGDTSSVDQDSLSTVIHIKDNIKGLDVAHTNTDITYPNENDLQPLNGGEGEKHFSDVKNICYEITLSDIKNEDNVYENENWQDNNQGTGNFPESNVCYEITLGNVEDEENVFYENEHWDSFEEMWRNCLNQNLFGQNGNEVFTCSKCPYISESKQDLKVHILNHFEIMKVEDDEKNVENNESFDDPNLSEYFKISLLNQVSTEVFQCSKCEFEAKHLRDVMRHLKMHKRRSMVKPFNCSVNESKVNDRQTLTKRGMTKVHKCPKCQYKTKSKTSLKKHLLIHNDSKLFRCSLCNFESNRKLYITLHMAKHNSGHGKCPDCGYEAKNPEDFQNHLLEHRMDQSANVNGENESLTKVPSLDTQNIEIIQCPECEFSTPRVNNFKNHLISHNDYKLYDCVKCSYQIDRKSRLINHLLDHYKMKLLACPKCDFRTNRSDNLNIHIATHKNIELLKCDKCNFKSYSEDYLKRHIMKHNLYRCFQCNFETQRKANLMDHMKVHRMPKPNLSKKRNGVFVCSMCDYRTNFKGMLEIHLLNKHSNTKLYKCTQCNFGTNLKSTLKNHLLNHMDKKLYNCTQCDYSTNKKHRIRSHLLKHNGYEFSCFDCQFATNDKIDFETHLLQYNHNPNNEKLLSCSYCDFKTFRRNNLDIHVLTHNPVDEIQCPECSFSTNRRDKFKNHLLVHNDNKKFECTKCSYEIDRKSRLVNHLLNHYDMKLIHCPHCDYKTNRTDGLNVHLLKHREAKLFKCSECGYETNARSYLRKHLAEHRLFKCLNCSFDTYSEDELKIHCLEHEDDKSKVHALILNRKTSKAISLGHNKKTVKVNSLVNNDNDEKHLKDVDQKSVKNIAKKSVKSMKELSIKSTKIKLLEEKVQTLCKNMRKSSSEQENKKSSKNKNLNSIQDNNEKFKGMKIVSPRHERMKIVTLVHNDKKLVKRTKADSIVFSSENLLKKTKIEPLENIDETAGKRSEFFEPLNSNTKRMKKDTVKGSLKITNASNKKIALNKMKIPIKELSKIRKINSAQQSEFNSKKTLKIKSRNSNELKISSKNTNCVPRYKCKDEKVS